MIMNICSCLQRTQIKLENVSAKNVQENTHTLQGFFCSHPQNVLGHSAHSTPRGASSPSRKHETHAPNAGSLQEEAAAHLFERLELHLDAPPGPRSTLQAPTSSPPQAQEAGPESRGPGAPGLAELACGSQANRSLCQMRSSRPANSDAFEEYVEAHLDMPGQHGLAKVSLPIDSFNFYFVKRPGKQILALKVGFTWVLPGLSWWLLGILGARYVSGGPR